MMAVFFFTAHEQGFTFHAQSQTGAYSCFNYSLVYWKTWLKNPIVKPVFICYFSIEHHLSYSIKLCKNTLLSYHTSYYQEEKAVTLNHRL